MNSDLPAPRCPWTSTINSKPVRTWATLLLLTVSHLPLFAQENILTHTAQGEPIYHPLHVPAQAIQTPHSSLSAPINMALIETGSDTNRSRFLMGRFLVTEAEYKSFVDATGHRPVPRHWRQGTYPAGRAAHPVPFVSLLDARRYCAWIRSNSGLQVVVPTAAQWERAATGPTPRKYPWGDTTDIQFQQGNLVTRLNYNGVLAHAWLRTNAQLRVTYIHSQSTHRSETFSLGDLKAYDSSGRVTPFAISTSGQVRGWVSHDTHTGFIYTDAFHNLNAQGGFTTPVGCYPQGASPEGCLDMAGNLWQWTESSIIAKKGAEKGQSVYEIRGGSWYAHAQSCQTRGVGEGRAAQGGYNTVGFRIAILLP